MALLCRQHVRIKPHFFYRVSMLHVAALPAIDVFSCDEHVPLATVLHYLYQQVLLGLGRRPLQAPYRTAPPRAPQRCAAPTRRGTWRRPPSASCRTTSWRTSTQGRTTRRTCCSTTAPKSEQRTARDSGPGATLSACSWFSATLA